MTGAWLLANDLKQISDFPRPDPECHQAWLSGPYKALFPQIDEV